MDGLLLDTERVCMRVFKEACEAMDQPFHQTQYLTIIGRNSAGIETILRNAYGSAYDMVHGEWRERYNAIVKHEAIPLKQGVIELLKWLKSKGIPTAVATSTQRDVAETKLELAGLTPYFDNITCGCEVSQGKPNPEIFLLAAERLGVEPSQCLAFEDSNNGVRAAVGAEMITYQVPDLVEPCDRTLALNPKVRSSLSQVLSELETHS